MDEKLIAVLEKAGINVAEGFELKYHTDALVHRLTDIIQQLAANQVTHEYDEDTGYCLCHCCDHGI